MISTKFNHNKLIVANFGLTIVLFISTITISVIILTSLSNEDRILKNYVEIRNSLDTGNNLRLIMDYKYMNYYFNGTKKESPDEKSGFDLSQYQFFARFEIGNPLEYIITSFNAFVFHPFYKSIFNYGKLRIYENDYFILESYFINPVNYSVIEYKTLNGTLPSKGLSFFQQTPKFRKYF